ncbi:hypothetical protein AAMO2058_001252100 [Amorphochlora amoebiformis]
MKSWLLLGLTAIAVHINERNKEISVSRKALEWGHVAGGVSPITRAGHTITYLPEFDQILLFGGCHLDIACFNEAWIFSLKKGSWSLAQMALEPPKRPAPSRPVGSPGILIPPVVRPLPRGRHTATRVREKIYIFGGSDNEQYMSDLYSVSLPTLWWEQIYTSPKAGGRIQAPDNTPRPTAREGHTAVGWNDRIFLFGGYTSNGYVSDLWQFDTTTQSWALLSPRGTGPEPRSGHSASLSADKIIIFGGSNDRETFNDIIVLDLLTRVWLRPKAIEGAVRPPPRHFHSADKFSDNSPNGVLLISSGCDPKSRDNHFKSDTWALDLNSYEWAFIPTIRTDIAINLNPSHPASAWNFTVGTQLTYSAYQDNTVLDYDPSPKPLLRDMTQGDGALSVLISNSTVAQLGEPDIPLPPQTQPTHASETEFNLTSGSASNLPVKKSAFQTEEIARQGAGGLVVLESWFLMVLGCGAHRKCQHDIVALNVKSLTSNLFPRPPSLPYLTRHSDTKPPKKSQISKSSSNISEPTTATPYSFRETLRRVSKSQQPNRVSAKSMSYIPYLTIMVLLSLLIGMIAWNLRRARKCTANTNTLKQFEDFEVQTESLTPSLNAQGELREAEIVTLRGVTSDQTEP